MKNILILFLFILLSSSNQYIQAQNWISYFSFTQVTDFADEGQYMWVSTNSGVFKTDLDGNIIKTFSQTNGLSDNVVSCIAIDKSGKKWFGTFSGVSVFDGQNWTYYNKTNGLLQNDTVTSIVIDNQNKIWIGTRKGINCLNGTVWTYYNTQNSGLTIDNVCKLIIDNNSTIWAGLSKGIAKFTGTSWTYSEMIDTPCIFNGEPSICEHMVLNLCGLAVDKNGNVWTGGWGGLFIFDGHKWHDASDSIKYTNENDIMSIHADNKNNIWIGTKNGIKKYDGAGWTNIDLYETRHKIDIHPRKDSVIRVIKSMSDGTVWVGTQEYPGVWQIKNDQQKELLTFDQKEISWSNDMVLDKNGNIWISAQRLLKFNGSSFTGDTITVASCTYADTSGNDIFVAADFLYIHKFTMGKYINRFQIDNKLFYPLDMTTDKSGNFWICGYKGIIGNYDKNGTLINSKLYELPQKSDVYRAEYCPYVDRIYFGTHGEGLWSVNTDGSKWANSTTNNGIASNYITALAFSPGKFWIGTDNGLSVYDTTSKLYSTYNTGNCSLLHNHITSIAIEKNGTAWIGTSTDMNGLSGGVSKFDGTNWTSFNTKNSGLCDNGIIDIIIDNKGNKWFLSHTGLAELTDFSNNIVPDANQQIKINQSGKTIYINETPVADSREWKYALSPDGPFQSFNSAVTGTEFYPQFSSIGTYYISCFSTLNGKTIQSNNIKITVDNQNIGINEHLSKKIVVYPNPSSGKIFIEVPETSDEVNLKVMNLQGQIIWEEKLNIFDKTEINIKNPGLYIIMINTKTENYFQKVVVH